MRRWTTSLLVIGLVLTACATTELDVTPTTGPAVDASAELAAARTRWASAPVDYTISFQDGCEGCEASTVAVSNGDVVSLAAEAPVSVEQVFATIEESLAAGADIDVEYDAELGFPTRVVIDLDGDGEADVDLRFRDLEAMPVVSSLDELLQARLLWEARGLDSYRFIMRVDCTCPEGGTFEVLVRNGRVDEVVPLDDLATASSVSPTPMSVAFDDLEWWFTASEELIEEGILDVQVRMDPELGYPRWFQIEGEGLDADGFDEPFTLIATFDVIEAIESQPVEVPAADDLAAWQAAFELWKRTHPSDYSFVLTRHCECPPDAMGPYLIEVADGVVQSVFHQPIGVEVHPDEVVVETIDDAFDLILDAIEAGTDVEVSYDPGLGHPTGVVIDPQAVAVDGGLAFSITELEALPDDPPPPPTAETGVVEGIVLAGPQCPVETDPPTPGCEDQPVAGAEMLVWEKSWTDALLVVSDADGRFVLQLKPGSYMFDPLPYEGLLGTAPSFEIEVVAGGEYSVTVPYDTGIR